MFPLNVAPPPPQINASVCNIIKTNSSPMHLQYNGDMQSGIGEGDGGGGGGRGHCHYHSHIYWYLQSGQVHYIPLGYL